MSPRRLHPVERKTPGPICGAYSVAAVTGTPVEQWVRLRGGKARGVSVAEMVRDLKAAGEDVVWEDFEHLPGMRRPTVVDVCMRFGAGIVITSGHALGFNDMLVNDTWTKRWTWAPDCPHAKFRVTDVLWTDAPKFPPAARHPSKTQSAAHFPARITLTGQGA